MEPVTGVKNLKCKFQFGNTVIEIEGLGQEDTIIVDKIASLMDVVIDSISSSDIQVVETLEPEDSMEDVVETKAEENKPEKRGGKRITRISPKLDELCTSGVIANVTPEEIMKMMKEKYALTATKSSVIMALNRRLNKTISRVAEPPGSENYKYTYHQPKAAAEKEALKTA
jgi:hypothetical protein